MEDEINLEAECSLSTFDGPQKEICLICFKGLTNEPLLRCAECPYVTICMQCFSLGLETQTHRCDHAYQIDRRHIPRDETDWTIQEDYKLLKCVLECGYGNEVDICKQFLHRTIADVRVRIHRLVGLDNAPLRCPMEVESKPILPYNVDGLREDPPRYPNKSIYFKYLGGYSAPRGDFSTEHENQAEQAMSNLSVSSDEEDSDEEITSSINCAIAENYNIVLKERARRKYIIKEHGLLLRRTSHLLHSSPYSGLHVFMQILNMRDFDSLYASMALEDKLKRNFFRLARYRTLGITRLRGIEMHDRLEQMRFENIKENKMMLPIMTHTRLLSSQPKTRRPLNVISYPGYELLAEKERELCTIHRIPPEIFLKGKKLFMEVSSSEGGIKLKLARTLLKIDVNKTRKIFNFLCEEMLITEIKS